MSETLADGARTTPETMLSPGLADDPTLGRAFELKFLLPLERAEVIETWARRYLTPDSHGDAGTYRIVSVYCDTPAFDVFHRTPGYRRSKFRLRRYGSSECVFLERKQRKGDRVRKQRVQLPGDELPLLGATELPPDWIGAAFREKLIRRGLRPTCQVGYQRTAFTGLAAGAPVRLTLDRDLIGVPASGWAVPPLEQGQSLAPEGALLELKFHVTMPELFRNLLAQIPTQTGRLSKYRTCVERCGLAVPIPRIDEVPAGLSALPLPTSEPA